MGRIGTIRVGETDLDDRLREVLEASGLERREFEDLDWFGLLPFFALAGASLRTDVEAHGDHFHFRGVALEVPDELEDAFFDVLPQILEQLSADEQAAEQAAAPDAVVHPSARGEEAAPRDDDEPVRDEEEPETNAVEREDGTGRGAGAAAATGSTATAGAGAAPTEDISESPDRDVTR